jgi:hypothetical protein
MIPLAPNSAYPFPEAEFERKAFCFPPVRQTGFLHPAASATVSTVALGVHACSALYTLSTSEGRINAKVFWRCNRAT